MTTSKNILGTMPMGRLLLHMAPPIMVSLLIQSLYNIVDSIFVAMLSEEALTATSLAYPVQMVMIAVGVGTAVGVNAVLSVTLGKGEAKSASHLAQTGLVLAALSALVFMAAGVFGAFPLAQAMTDNAAIARQCGQYLQICMVFCLGNLACMVFQRLLQAVGKASLSMMILVSGALCNIILDPILIFGLAGLPALGVCGAAWATVIGQWVSMGVGLYLNLRHNPGLNLLLPGFHLNKDAIIRIYRIGIPTIVMQLLNSFMVFAFNAILLPFSSTAVAFFGVYYKLQSFLFMPMSGLGQADIPIVGYNFGRGNHSRILQNVRQSVIVACLMALAGMAVFLLFSRQLLLLFSAGPEMLAIGQPALRILSITFIPASMTTVLGFVLSALGKGRPMMIASLLRQFFPLLPLAWLFCHLGGIEAGWFSFWISEAAGCIYILLCSRQALAPLRCKKAASCPE